MDTISYQARVKRADIGYVNSIIESYEGIGVVRTFDASAGIIELWIPPAFESLVLAILRDIGDDVGLRDLRKLPHRLSA